MEKKTENKSKKDEKKSGGFIPKYPLGNVRFIAGRDCSDFVAISEFKAYGCRHSYDCGWKVRGFSEISDCGRDVCSGVIINKKDKELFDEYGESKALKNLKCPTCGSCLSKQEKKEK